MLGSSEGKAWSSARPVLPGLGALPQASDGILDMLPVATFVCDARGTILQYNRRATELWGRAPQPGQTHDQFSEGSRFYELDGTPAPRSLVNTVLETGVAVRDAERIVERANGSRMIVSINVDPLRNAAGEVIGAVNCFLDITERQRITEALELSHHHALEQEQRLAATYEHAAIGIAEVAPDGRFIRVNEAVCDITGYSREHLLSVRLFTYTHKGDAEPDREGFRKQVAGEAEFYSVQKRLVRRDGRLVWLSVRSSPVRDPAGRLLYVVRVMQDITQRKAAERRQRLLIDELNHRVKNTLATVQSLAAQTARAAPTPEDFRHSFEGRLIALSKAHDQLTRHHWENADLRNLLAGSLAPYAGGADRVVLRGEDLALRPRAVLTLAMAFHELATNAAKYGALSVPGGRVEIRWETQADAEGKPQLTIEWTELDGPPVAEPDRRGFGSRLIEGSVASELGGSAELTFARQGLRCVLVVPTAAEAQDTAAPAGMEPD